MSTSTAYLGLVKPDPSEFYDISIENSNKDKIDTGIQNINNTLGSGVILNPVLYYGMNSKITNTGKDSALPKIKFTGQSYVNLLGKDGNCEDVSKWTYDVNAPTISTSVRAFGSGSIKIVAGASYDAIRKSLATLMSASKYYLLTGYGLNYNLATGIDFTVTTNGTGAVERRTTSKATSTTTWTRLGALVSPSDMGTSPTTISVNAIGTGTVGQYGYVDGIMVIEITATEYALGVTALLAKYPYVDSYACLQNPYVQTIHDNLVRNGNGEEGIGWWATVGSTAPTFTYSSGYFIITDNDSASNQGVIQQVSVKVGNTYFVSAIGKCGTSTDMRLSLIPYDDKGNVIAGRIDLTSTSTSDYTFTSQITIPIGATKLAIVFGSGIGASTNITDTGTVYFKNIMLIEGTTAPSTYLPFRQERTEIEGMFTSDDTVTLENGKVSGLINWKHKTLFGKDYDWQYQVDASGFKQIQLVLNPSNMVTYLSGFKYCVKYDGKILKPSQLAGAIASSDMFYDYQNTGIEAISISDIDTGWAETIAPNADEVKAFMNGWRANWNDGTRYICFINTTYTSAQASMDINAFPNGSATTLTVAATGTTTITVADATIFKVGDIINVWGTGSRTITLITGNVITVNTATAIATIGITVSRVDLTGTDTRLITFCKANVAPNYQGYQLHYKLANPEPITDVNTPIHGNIPKLDVGDNYVYLDSGIVLGEVSNPSTNGTYWWINASDSYMNSVLASKCQLKNKVENINGIYKNTVDDTKNWTNAFGLGSTLAYGNAYLYNISPQVYDSTAVYVVDYKILSTQAPQVGSIACSYSQDVFTAIQKLEETMENKQPHDSALDTLVDLSMYEKFINWTTLGRFTTNGSATNLSLFTEVVLVAKKVVPVVTLSNMAVIYYTSSGSPNMLPLSSVLFTTGIWNNHLRIRCFYTGGDATIVSNLLNYGGYFVCDIVADCRGRV